ncbi:hypothetical protein ACFLU3_05295 [Chloroflexota bacterium]
MSINSGADDINCVVGVLCSNAAFSTQRSWIQILSPRPSFFTLPYESLFSENNIAKFPHQNNPDQRLKIVYKAMFYFVRAYQDAIYGIILEFNGKKAGSYSSMHKKLTKQTSPVYITIMDKFPEYREWFYRWRDKRDRIKLGVGLSMAGPGADVGITFERVSEKGGIIVDCQDNIRLSDVTEAIRMSILLAETVLKNCKEKENK